MEMTLRNTLLCHVLLVHIPFIMTDFFFSFT